MGKHITSGNLALRKLLEGVNLIADPVKATLGPSGRNCIYERFGTNLPVSTRDGVTVAEAIESSDPFEAIGVNLIKGVAREAVDQSGDGTTTATLLAQAIFAEGVKAITVGANPVAIKRGIENAAAAVLAALRSMAVPVSGDMLRSVATISANNDEHLGGLIADAISKAGPDGVVTVEVSQSPDSSLKVVEGLQLGNGFISPNFITDPQHNECVLTNCSVYLHASKLATITPMAPLLKELATEKRSLLVIAEDVTDEALAVMEIAARNTDARLMTLPCAAVRTPGSVDILGDIAALTGARVHTDLLGVKLRDVARDFLGHADRVIVKPTTTTIITNAHDYRFDDRLEQLRVQVSEAATEGDRIRLQARLARLSGGVVIIRVGAATELEMNERKDRIEDALHATRCAQKEGVVAGGGIALLRARVMAITPFDDAGGFEILKRACAAPLRTLAENCGESPEFILKTVLELYAGHGWNALTGQYGDMFEMGIIDPLRVVRVALESAVSVASLMLITNCLVANERPK